MIKAVIIAINGEEHRVTIAQANKFVQQMAKLKAESEPEKKAEKKPKTTPRPELRALWEAAPKQARTRSSGQEVLDAWKKVPEAERPTKDVLLTAYAAWMKCEQWTRDDGAYIPGLHRWVSKRQWENVPEEEEEKGGLPPMKV